MPISEIEIGDTVIAYDEETGITGEYTVTDTISHEDESIAYVTISGEEIETTPWHLFYTGEGWAEAEDLQEGDSVVSLGGVYGTVDSVIIVDTVQTMYDLTVEEVHTFAVGDGDWVVHNCENLVVSSRRFEDYRDETIFEVTVTSRVNERVLGRFQVNTDHSFVTMYVQTRDITGESPVDITGANIRGREVFDTAWTEIQSQVGNVNMLIGLWEAGDLGTNFTIFEQNIANGMSPSQAALNTPTGSYAQAHGYTNARVRTHVEGSRAEVWYTKPAN